MSVMPAKKPAQGRLSPGRSSPGEGWPIYLDTEALFQGGWPRPNQKLVSLADQARTLSAPLIIPEPARIERRKQWVREYVKRSQAAGKALGEVGSWLRGINAAPMLQANKLPPAADVEDAYESLEVDTVAGLAIALAPTTTQSVTSVFELAAAQQLPFRENGTGFKDAVILLSIIDDLRRRQRTAAFLVTANKRDFEPALVVLARGLQVLVVSLDEAPESLRLLGSMRNWDAWTAIREEAAGVVEENRALLERYAIDNLRLSGLELGVPFGLLEFQSMVLSSIASVHVPFDHPPGQRTAVPLTILADLTVELLVERLPATPLFRVGLRLRGGGSPWLAGGALGTESKPEPLTSTVRVKFEGELQCDTAGKRSLRISSVEASHEHTLRELLGDADPSLPFVRKLTQT